MSDDSMFVCSGAVQKWDEAREALTSLDWSEDIRE